MRRSVVGGLTIAAVVAVGTAWWLAQSRGPVVVKPGRPLPDGETVQLEFPADENGEAETWVVTRRDTTREESVRGFEGSRELPSPDPAGKDHTADESARALDDLARDAWRGGEIDQALELYRKAVEADRDDWVSHAQYGRLLGLMHDIEGARPLLERAAALSPDDSQRWLDLHTLYQRSGETGLAHEARERAEALADGRPIAQDPLGWWTVEGSETFP